MSADLRVTDRRACTTFLLAESGVPDADASYTPHQNKRGCNGMSFINNFKRRIRLAKQAGLVDMSEKDQNRLVVSISKKNSAKFRKGKKL